MKQYIQNTDNKAQQAFKKMGNFAILALLMFLPFTGKSQTRTVIMPATGALTTTVQTTWTVPTGVYFITVETIGGGGGGKSGGNGGGGGGGGYSYKAFAVTPGTIYHIQAGKAGSGGATSGGNGSAGDTSYFKSGGYSGTTIVSANAGTADATAGTGASAGTGDIATAGGNGGKYTSGTGSGGGGGAGGFGGAGSAGPIGSQPNWTGASGGPGNPHAARGNGGRASSSEAGFTGNWYGGGGGGSCCSNQKGGNGGPGAVIITYKAIAPITPVVNNGNSVLCSGGTTQLQVNLPTGGTISSINESGTDYYVHKFTTSAIFDFFNSGGNIGGASMLIVGGGGGGGRNGGGGGGAGEYISLTSQTLSGQKIYPVLVGDGGIGAPNLYPYDITGYRGGVSYFNGTTANGGGGGASRDAGGPAMAGGSGGGGAACNGCNNGQNTIPSPSSVKLSSGSGYSGGTGVSGDGSCNGYAGGGGGAGGAGSAGSTGTGGAGTQNSITGTSLYYAAGGGAVHVPM
jgi:hypothetical protein